MMDNEKPKYRLGLGHATIARLVDGAIVDERPLDYKTMTLKGDNPNPDEKQVAFSFAPPTLSFEAKMTTEQAESFLGAFTEPRLIAKISTKKGDLYAPVKSHSEGSITLDIPDTEAEMWQQSDYWKAKLAEQERRLEAIKRGEGE